MVFRILENAFVRQKIESSFLFMFLKKNSPLGSHHQPPGKEKLLTSPRLCFLKNYPPSPRRKEEVTVGEDWRKLWELKQWKQWPKSNLWWNWSEVLINHTIFARIIFLVTVLRHLNSDSSVLKYECSLK